MSFWRYEGIRRSRRLTQGLFSFQLRAVRRQRRFKQATLLLTAFVVLGAVLATPAGRGTIGGIVSEARSDLERLVGLPVPRSEIDARLHAERVQKVRETTAHLERFYRQADPAIQHLFDTTGMAPGSGLIRWGNFDQTLLLSSDVFEPDDEGRSYRLEPSTRSVWLRQITLKDGPFALLLIPDTREARAAGQAAGGIVVEGSEQTTNSWGCRGPEPDLNASLLGIVLGDSYMQGTFIGDDQTAPRCLERALARQLDRSVTILNTGVLGYSPEQYFYSLKEYGARFPRLDFVVLALFANDFGDANDVLMSGKGDWNEAAYWMGEIQQYCRARSTPLLITPVPCEPQIITSRKDGFYPGLVANLCRCGALDFINPLDAFIDEHLRLKVEAEQSGHPVSTSPLYNGHIGDGHFSPAGAELWGRVVGQRLALLLQMRGTAKPRQAGSDQTSRSSSAGSSSRATIRSAEPSGSAGLCS